jgi:hypothetical protein
LCIIPSYLPQQKDPALFMHDLQSITCQRCCLYRIVLMC